MPDAVGSAHDVVGMLAASGYAVIVNKVGIASLHECTVTAVGPGPNITERVTAGSGGAIESPSYTTVYVDVKC